MKERIVKKLNNPIYALFGITVLLVSIAGSAYAYYQATATNNTTVNGIAAGSGSLSLNVTLLSTSATGNLIPMDTDLTVLNQAALGYGNNSGYNATKQCIDKYGYTVCKVYQISVTNTGSVPVIITGGVTSLSGMNTPNLTCTVMSDNHTVSVIKTCRGFSTLANKVTLAANATGTYYVMVYINNKNGVQTDSGTFNGTVEFNTGDGGVKAKFYETADETITKMFTKTGTVTNNGITYDIDTSNSLIKDTNGNIRFFGNDPDNYIQFNCDTYPDTNCEMWRIIGIVDGKLKIIRNEPIGGFSWDTSAANINSGYGINEWSQADLMKLINPGFEGDSHNYITNGSLYYLNAGDHHYDTCYVGASNATMSCEFPVEQDGIYGLKNNATRNMISVSTYYTGAFNDSYQYYANELLEKERGTSVVTNTNDDVTRTTTWTGRVALPYPSDYAYASDFRYCTDNVLNYDSNCTSNNWMYSILTVYGDGWFLNASDIDKQAAWSISSSGSLESDLSVADSYAVVPTLYLSPDVSFFQLAGIGTLQDPYLLN